MLEIPSGGDARHSEPLSRFGGRDRPVLTHLGRDALHALSRQPLQPVKPQQPLDVGLFEYRLPEAPEIVIPDE